MAKKKIYAVRKGHKTGLFATWAECQKAVSGYSGAEFRGFTEKEEALAFLNMETAGRQREQKAEDKLNQAVERAKQAEQNAKTHKPPRTSSPCRKPHSNNPRLNL